MNTYKKKCIILLGPTATGKTAFGVKLANLIHAEIISADSRQVYRGLDIGSGKDISEYTLPNGTQIPYHLIDIAEPASQEYSLADFLIDSGLAVDKIIQNGKIPLFVGGTALYLHALLSEYELHGGTPDEKYRQILRDASTEQLRNILAEMSPDSEILKTEPNNRIRIMRGIEQLRQQIIPPASSKEKEPAHDREYLILGVYRTRQEVRAKIEQRLDVRLNEGMLEEVQRLHDNGTKWERLESFGLEYRYAAQHLQGKISFGEMRSTLLAKICQFAKRQDSWFRKMEREGYRIFWFRPEETDYAFSLCQKFLHGQQLPYPAMKLSETLYGKQTTKGKNS